MNITEQAAQVLAEIEEQLAICEKATDGPWSRANGTQVRLGKPHYITVAECNSQGCTSIIPYDNAAFISSARTVCPKSLRCLKTAIEGLLQITESETSADPYEACNHPSDASEMLTALIAQWNENK